jgi:tRNA(adenine34) deaminase
MAELAPATSLPATAPDADERFMDEAIAQARLAAGEGEVPIGAVVVVDGRVVGRGRNARERLQDPTAHAEVLALQEAARSLGRWRLTGATIYATLEPCPMCAGALVNGRVDRLVYAVEDPKAGATGTLFDIARDPRLNHRLDVRSGVRAAECAELLRSFFREKRRRGTEG